MMILSNPPELAWIWAGVAVYAAATPLAMAGGAKAPARERLLLGLLGLGLALFAFAIGVRWTRIGHGPFINMFEILASNLFSLGFIYALAYWRLPALRPGAAVAMPVMLVPALWLLAVSPADSHLPPTYDTPWLWVHVATGKIFLGICLVALGLAGVMLSRRAGFARRFRAMPADAALDRLAWRFMGVALAFHSLMLISGAVWAQDAWGRYWAWDPIEAWAFLTWLAMAAALHLRTTWRVPPWLGAAMILGIFVLAFLTFFGVPFLSNSPHKGAI